jgi:hypothetical protein
VTRLRGHVADRLIADDRDPTPADQAHIDTCPACFVAVRRRRPFDLRLADAARDLVTELLPREVLLVDAPTQGRRAWWTPAAILAAFLLLVAVGVGGFVVWQTAPGTPTVGAREPVDEPVGDATGGVQVVQVPGDDLGFTEVQSGVMVVMRLSSPEPQMLSKVPLPVGGSVGYAMVCTWSDDLQMGFVYGVLEPARGRPTFVGPDAAAGGSADGLFLFAFNPFLVEKQGVTVTSADGTGLAFSGDVFASLLKNAAPDTAPAGAPGAGCRS